MVVAEANLIIEGEHDTMQILLTPQGTSELHGGGRRDEGMFFLLHKS